MRKLEDLNFYELLDLGPSAEKEEVENAFRVAIRTYGSDSLAVYSVLSEEQRGRLLARIEQAYAVLSDDSRRGKYDRQLGLAGSPTQVAPKRSSAGKSDSDFERTGSIWDRVRQVIPAKEKLGARVSRILKTRNAGQKQSQMAISSGQYLASVRKMRGISLEEISQKTKIKVRYLRAFEQEDYESLPSGVYKRYILKALAEAIDLDPEAVADDFKSRRRR